MPSTFSPNFNLELMATGEFSGTWGQRLDNNVFSILDAALGNTLSLPLTNVNVTLNTAQSQNNFIDLSGVLTANVQVIFPAIGRTYFIRNGTSGAFTVTLKTSAVGGATYVIQQGQARFITLNGTDVITAFDGGNGALVNIASAATTDLGAVLSQNANITGTATITSFGSSAKMSSPLYQITFAGALILTYNATSLITPSGGNIYTQAGDSALVLYLGSGNWQILNYSANNYVPGVQPIAGGFRNLVVTATSSTAVSITADAATLEDASGRAYRARNINISAALTTSGANGLDTGVEAASTWYSVWLIYNQATNTLASLLSASATAPTLPVGYTYKARFGWVRNDASANLWRSKQYGRVVQIITGTNPATPPVIASGIAGSPSAPTYVSAPVGSFVPTTASKIRLTFGNGQFGAYIISANNTRGGVTSTTNPAQVGLNSNGSDGPVTAELVLESTNIYYAFDHSAAICLEGWEDNL